MLFSFCDSEKIVCYYGSWSTYRHGNGEFNVANIDPSLCTHAIYTFVGLNEDATIKVLDPYLDLQENWGRGNFRKFVSLKQSNPQLKVLIAIGGWNVGSAPFSNVMSKTLFVIKNVSS